MRRYHLGLVFVAGSVGLVGAGPPALDPPAPAAVAEGRKIVEAMKASERGPYLRIRWYCNDGTVHPPSPYACRERGGGRQHAEYSEARRRLAELGWPVGTVLAATSWDELWNGKPRQRRLRELPLERYLVDVDDGWVMRRARYYRGHVQIEDEERAGKELLLRMLAERDFVREEYLVARELVRTLPHHGSGDRTRAVRRASQEIAEKDRSFEPVRTKIHTRPRASDAELTREWIAAARRRGASAEIVGAAEKLARDLDELYGVEGRAARLDAARRAVPKTVPGYAGIDGLLTGVLQAPPGERARRLGRALRDTRDAVGVATDPVARLRLIDLSIEVESALLATGTEMTEAPRGTRRQLVSVALALLDGAYGAGLVSARERDALAGPLEMLGDVDEVATERYLEAANALRRAGVWAAGTVRYSFGEALVAFGSLEPEAWRFTDELLRGSTLLPLAEVSRRLSVDAESRSGLTHRMFGKPYTALLGLNPGVARGPLRVVRAEDLRRGVSFGRNEIVVLPETVSELEPVAGIVSLSSGNLLSHVQLLARNLGIPNATLPPRLLDEIERHDGASVLLVVGTRGSVFLERLDRIKPDALSVLEPREAKNQRAKIEPPRPDLGVRGPIPLEDLHAGLSGKVVGPKAANLGELARKFPGRVAPAVALPFGVFAEHVSGSPDSPKGRLDRAFARHRKGEIDDAVLESEVEAVRREVLALRVSPRLRSEIVPLLGGRFGPDGSYGAFVRSDTNVEDLPGFTGAGLNETVPNVVGLDRILDAVPRVWSSPFTRRAMAWRSSVLARPEEVYASVLIMKSVPADKSGVLVTTDLERRRPGLTVAIAWGVGGAVDGEAAETIAIGEDGSVELLSEAKAPYRRKLSETGGVAWVPAPSGAVLTSEEIHAVRELAADVRGRLTPARGPDGRPLPWDVEFGFVAGKISLFQVRPLVERGQALADRMVAMLMPEGAKRIPLTALDEPVGNPSSVAGRVVGGEP